LATETQDERGSTRKSLKRNLYSVADKAGVFRLGRRLWPEALTVVNYHRIEDVTRPGIDSFKPNISASPEAFNWQMAYLKRWFSAISIEELVAWLEDREPLPPNPALITFDDGYLDNYVHAYPVLRQHNLPALIFLTSGHIGTDKPFYWDMAAYCFKHTGRESVHFPDGSEVSWETEEQKEEVNRSLTEALKRLPQEQKEQWAARLPEQLGVSIPQGHFKRLMLNWELVREMHAGGIRFGGHTISHPILTRVSAERARQEIAGCKEQIERELGAPALSFAYPNGMQGDWNAEMEGLLKEAGYRAAFTLLSGPASLKEVKESPFAIRRIFISHRHGREEFTAMLSPWNRVLAQRRQAAPAY
jgi:peptidoglycan/xylan/chitin deacetylase (PgdA/CDA1 family)